MYTTKLTVIALNITGLLAWGAILQTEVSITTRIAILTVIALHGIAIMVYTLAATKPEPVHKHPIIALLSPKK